MAERLASLIHTFRQQEEFARGYSPLYARLFGIEASWLEGAQTNEDPLVTWLLRAGASRKSIDISLLLNAGLHRQILAKEPGAAELTDYFPTAGGSKSSDDPRLAEVLRKTILAFRQQLSPFIRQAKVQTNETGRGLCWLLPVLSTDWPSIHLLDLGASAGLNLVADLRAYRLINDSNDQLLLDTGKGKPAQFLVRSQGELSSLEKLQSKTIPNIASRTGYDLAPFPLETNSDQLALKSFIWGDQVTRMERLQEGMAAFKQVVNTNAPVSLHRVNLPAELSSALTKNGPRADGQPVVIYNTIMTFYLKDKGGSLFHHIESWAVDQERPILWLQWEPARDPDLSPGNGRFAWTADVWLRGQHFHWFLGRVHPHGVEVEFTEGFQSWNDFWDQI